MPKKVFQTSRGDRYLSHCSRHTQVPVPATSDQWNRPGDQKRHEPWGQVRIINFLKQTDYEKDSFYDECAAITGIV